MKTLLLPFLLGTMMSIGSAQEPSPSPRTFNLSMMNQCIDDMFDNCKEKMEEQVQKVYFPREIKNEEFKAAWEKSETCSIRKLQNLQRMYSQLTINHTRALCVYTEEEPNIYRPLNAALRNGAANYSTSNFQYHALYFWITTALQILKPDQSIVQTYRKTGDVYNGQVNQTIRFGHFASSSLNSSLDDFGSETCFHIKTRLGANIDKYSEFAEEEVLIPPYEKFKITKIVPNSYEKLECTKIFVLESEGQSSKLNCKAANHNQKMRANRALTIGFQILIGLTWSRYPVTSI
ncbi:hypothetical protein NL108_009955 [Boleophthalmus pectinirostris]|uniref:T-cell ecto-ADP-ribosyltransferase 1-like n=1 Tax=Boleophthalmus pectinirostris TaxID=150288 RepID=UPI002431FECD|nr:T-cell ecto-ADP-ribosyltransferase 1-like [Boleophthalmus pectinirostris]KAJ0055707.1 hypothetical protein NL108_009955 [Boleophthalmus pectinirostris]